MGRAVNFLLAVAALIGPGCAGPGDTVNLAAQAGPSPGDHSTSSVATLDTSLLASLLETQDEYVLGAGDVVEVSVLDLLELGKVHTVEVVVGADGAVVLPLVGTLQAREHTVGAVQRELTTRLARFIREPSVSLRLLEHRSQRIAVLGQVNAPGVKALEHNRITVSHALALAGGLKDPDVLQRARLLRARSGESVEIDLTALAGGDLSQNVSVGPGDVLQVLDPEQFYVSGYVARPGAFPLRRGTTALRAVALASGVLVPDASPSRARIHRPGPGGVTTIPVDLVAVAEGEAEDPLIHSGDNLEVTQTDLRFVVVGVYNVLRGVFSVGYNLASLF